jgi:hypothetical protein
MYELNVETPDVKQQGLGFHVWLEQQWYAVIIHYNIPESTTNPLAYSVFDELVFLT